MTSEGARDSWTLMDCLLAGCEATPDRRLYTVLGDGENETGACTYAELLIRVQRVAGVLRDRQLRGKTVLLLIRDQLRFIETFVGCLWSGAIPVPAALPRPDQAATTLRAVATDARVAAAISSEADLPTYRAMLAEAISKDAWLTAEAFASADPSPSAAVPSRSDIALVQYTSGSTGRPKGVVVTHANLMGNEDTIHHAMKTSRETVFLAWLPLYHDMGLIGNVLQPIYVSGTCVVMPPVTFLQRPLRWLQAITRYRATISGGPNFAYDLCIDRIPPAAREGLDLSSWDVAFNASEPVRAKTIDAFCAAYVPHGLRRSSIYPCYGLAESTLFVSGNLHGTGPHVLCVAKSELEKGRAAPASEQGQSVQLVSSGVAGQDTHIVIADPIKSVPVEEGAVGEVWASSRGVASGYFGRERESPAEFAAQLAGDTSGKRFLRTGDLGFLKDEQLYITGRLKDVIIIRGRNYYPQDLEAAAFNSNTAIARGLAAAVVLDEDDAATVLCLVCELTRSGWRSADYRKVVGDVREAIAIEHGLQVNRVLLIRPGTLPRTSSGKIRRSTCREMIRNGGFETLSPAGTPPAAVSRAHDPDPVV